MISAACSVLRGLDGKAHHQHGADREVRRDEDVRPAQAFQLGDAESARADHDVDSGGDARARVGERDLRLREVDDDLAFRQDRGELDAERRVRAARELEIVGLLNRVAGRGAHAPGGAGYANPDHVATARSG